MTRPIYAVADIHGHLSKLTRALDLIERDGGAGAEIVFLGDYVDRGPDSRGVIETLVAGQAVGRPWHVLRGNHDQLFLRFLQTGALEDPHIRSGVNVLHPVMGMIETLASYGVADAGSRPVEDVLAEARARVPAAHIELLDGLPRYLERADLLFVHAGIAPHLPLEWQNPDDFLWIRKPFLEHTEPYRWLVIHGHTSIEHPEHRGNRINLDGGAGFGRPLHPAVIEGRECWLLTDTGRVPLRP